MAVVAEEPLQPVIERAVVTYRWFTHRQPLPGGRATTRKEEEFTFAIPTPATFPQYRGRQAMGDGVYLF